MQSELVTVLHENEYALITSTDSHRQWDYFENITTYISQRGKRGLLL
jgi:hypothetical protein